MKAVVESCVRTNVPGIKNDARCGKTSPAKSDFDSREMRDCFSKLQSLVPSMNKREGKVDKTELLQSVIDYILDLEDFLASGALCAAVSEASGIVRQPLAEKSDCNIRREDAMVALSTSVQGLATIEDFDFRPPSK